MLIEFGEINIVSYKQWIFVIYVCMLLIHDCPGSSGSENDFMGPASVAFMYLLRASECIQDVIADKCC